MTEDQGRDRRRLSISDDAPGPLHNQGTKVTIYPSWLDRRSYPFESRYIDVDGGRMHYVDHGEGEPLLMVHGTPTWSYLYRHLIRDLSREYRVIAPDHLGFGLSDKFSGADYRPQTLAQHLGTFIDRLGLKKLTLVVHDFGGPIGLSYAIVRPENVRAIVLFNTWLWSLRGTPAERGSRFMAGPVGRCCTRVRTCRRAFS